MKEKTRIKAKINFLVTALAIGWPSGFLLSALGYYLTGMSSTRMALQFMLITGGFAFGLALICGYPFMIMTEARIRDGIMPINTYRRESSNFLCFMPQNAIVQILICALLTGLRFLFVAGGVAVLLGTVDSEMDLLAGTLLCGLICGIAVVYMAHYMVMMKSSAMDTEARRRKEQSGKKKRQTAQAEEKTERKTRSEVPEVKEAKEAEAKKTAETQVAPEKTETAPSKKAGIELPAFEIPKVSRSGKGETLRAPQPKRRQEKETPTEEFDLPKETRHYPSNARTGVLPDMETLGLDFEDLDDLGEE